MLVGGKKKDALGIDLGKIERLQMYKIPPIHKIGLEEFEAIAIDRLKVLREVEMIGMKRKKDSKEYYTDMGTAIRKFWKYTYSTNDQDKKDQLGYAGNVQKELLKDNTSHFILRLAYCKSDELQRWFMSQELDLFKYRFKEEALSGSFKKIERFLEKNNLKYSPISKEEQNKRKSELAAADYKMDTAAVEATDYYKVPFIEVLDLVRSRRVFLEKGYAYVPKECLVSIISNCFQLHLSHELGLTAAELPDLGEDERLLPRLTTLSELHLGQGYQNKKVLPGEKITLDQIDAISKTSYPLCMRQLHEAIRRDHHLKHGGRLQYGLFLKGIGLTLEEALMFWRSEFTRIMDADKFQKQYSYSIRHSFGKEGKRLDYTPYSCMKIIQSNHPGKGDYHGCPFRHFDADNLKQKLVSYGVPKPGIDEILGLVKDCHYQLACARYFEVTHKVSLSHTDAVNHPNKYVVESRRVYEELSSGTIKQEPLDNTSIAHLRGGVGIKTEKIIPSTSQKYDVKSEPANGVLGYIDMEDLDDADFDNMDDTGMGW